MRPRLNEDAFYIAVPEGIYLRNARGELVIKGRTIYTWIERLAPHLDGSHTVEELTAGLDAEKAELVATVIETLHANGFLRDVEHDLPHALSAHELEHYAPEIAFIDAAIGSGAHHFERFRAQRMLVVGSGLLLCALAHAALRIGLREVAVLPLTEDGLYRERLPGLRKWCAERDPAQTLREIAPPDWDDQAPTLAALEPYDAVLHASDRPLLAYARRLNAICVAAGKPLLQAVVTGDHAWVGPLVEPGARGCWECAWRRLQANLDGSDCQPPRDEFADTVAGEVSPYLALPTAALVAGYLTFELFKHVTGAGPLETHGGMVDVDLETALTRSQRFLPHPLCAACSSPAPPTRAAFRATIARLGKGEPCDAASFSQRAAACFDTRLGILCALEEGDLAQMPLAAATVTVSNPLPGATSEPPLVLAATGPTYSEARRRATLRGLEAYAGRLVDSRRLVASPEARARAPRIARELVLRAGGDAALPTGRDACAPSRPTQEDKAAMWAWASSLPGNVLQLVPAEAAFPALTGSAPSGEGDVGLGSGMNWAEAASRALLGWASSLTLAELGSAGEPYPRVELDAVALEAEGSHLLRLLETVAESVTVYDVTGRLGIPTFAICVGEVVAAYATHTDVAAALADGFERAMARWQFRDAPVPGMPARVLPELPYTLRGSEPAVPESVAPTDWEACLDWLVTRFRQHGWQPLVVPLDHDPALADVLPNVVRVLLASAS